MEKTIFMKILIVNTSDIDVGAERAACRRSIQTLFKDLINIKEYCSYNSPNTPFPPLAFSYVPKIGFSI